MDIWIISFTAKKEDLLIDTKVRYLYSKFCETFKVIIFILILDSRVSKSKKVLLEIYRKHLWKRNEIYNYFIKINSSKVKLNIKIKLKFID